MKTLPLMLWTALATAIETLRDGLRRAFPPERLQEALGQVSPDTGS